jgi:hypothetical protein
MAIQLTEHCAKVEVSVSERFGVVEFEFQFQGLDEVGEGGPDFASPAVVAGEVVVGGCLEFDGVPGHQLCLAKIIQGQLEFLFL